MKKIFLILILPSILTLYGCQKSPAPIKNQPASTEVNIPYSKGPSGPPKVNGPSTTPPSSSAINQNQNRPEAITNNENIKLTLPLKKS